MKSARRELRKVWIGVFQHSSSEGCPPILCRRLCCQVTRGHGDTVTGRAQELAELFVGQGCIGVCFLAKQKAPLMRGFYSAYELLVKLILNVLRGDES